MFHGRFAIISLWSFIWLSNEACVCVCGFYLLVFIDKRHRRAFSKGSLCAARRELMRSSDGDLGCAITAESCAKCKLKNTRTMLRQIISVWVSAVEMPQKEKAFQFGWLLLRWRRQGKSATKTSANVFVCLFLTSQPSSTSRSVSSSSQTRQAKENYMLNSRLVFFSPISEITIEIETLTMLESDTRRETETFFLFQRRFQIFCHHVKRKKKRKRTHLSRISQRQNGRKSPAFPIESRKRWKREKSRLLRGENGKLNKIFGEIFFSLSGKVGDAHEWLINITLSFLAMRLLSSLRDDNLKPFSCDQLTSPLKRRTQWRREDAGMNFVF